MPRSHMTVRTHVDVSKCSAHYSDSIEYTNQMGSFGLVLRFRVYTCSSYMHIHVYTFMCAYVRKKS
jgi:hypothetical protein